MPYLVEGMLWSKAEEEEWGEKEGPYSKRKKGELSPILGRFPMDVM